MEPILHKVDEPLVVIPESHAVYGMTKEELIAFKQTLVMGHQILMATIETVEERFLEV